MDFELFNECVDDDYTFGAEYSVNENLVVEGDEEGQRCGICMDVVVDRGVLDCCQHWFCFSCIDNWASITNLCPLCQNEFQLITCVPVYDTIGGAQPDDDSESRDDDEDDWSVEENNSTLSFPSYYIDENAVSCLEGNSCKIRGQLANVEDDPDLDTSIACDSCDLWYHAICVGFDTEGSCENSWLCPRCLVDETSQKLEVDPSNHNGSESSSHEHSVDLSFPMNVSVSVADAGETAVVVSIIDRNQHTKLPGESKLTSVNTSNNLKTGNQENGETDQKNLPASNICEDDCKSEKELAEKVTKKPKIESVELDPCLSLIPGLIEDFKDETSEPSVSDGLRTSELHDNNSSIEPLESDVHLVSSTIDPLSDKSKTTVQVEEKKVSKVCRRPVDKNHDKKEKAGGVAGVKRKQRYHSADAGETKMKIPNSVPEKIAKEGKSQGAHSVNKANDSKHLHKAIAGPRGAIVKKRKAEIDIRDIVQGTHRPSKQLSEGKETSSGLRIKKIMRRTTDNKESLEQVQNLRKEIRDAIRNRSPNDFGKNVFDPKLLAAFRTALAGQTNETKRPLPLDVKAKKALLQKGTVRENLTKKIYGIGGKRKRAWTRDCEVEFWKHRCSKVSKPEKLETLKSVLDLLRKGPEATEIKKEKTVQAPSSILSRLYVADASVFPRKDDIKPLSVQPTNSLVDRKETVVAVPYKNGGPATMKVKSNKDKDQSSKSISEPVKNVQKESGSGSTNMKFDKKKWALEVLARKTAVSGNNSSQGQDNAVLKGNYPLLAKLPVEMRPCLASCRHNKIPISVRQVQLYRLTEHFLRKTNLPVTRPTAEIELAVADAINVEKAVADRSNSKLVYLNLCSQELLRRSDNMDSCTDHESEPKPDPKSPTHESETKPDPKSATHESETKPDPKSANDDRPIGTDIDVDEALRNAGLLSDSPPDSPRQQDEDGPDNVFEIDTQPELDIYGDFEYDLEDDDDFIGTNTIKASKVQQDDTKIKMVFSTLDVDSSWRFEGHEAPVEVAKDNMNEKTSVLEGGEDGECEELYGPDKEPLISKYPEIKPLDLVQENIVAEVEGKPGSNLDITLVNSSSGGDNLTKTPLEKSENREKAEDLPKKPQETVERKDKKLQADKKQQSDNRSSVYKKVEAYIKEHIRPLCKSGVITVDQYRWAVGKTTDKIMKYHSKDTNANFLIKEGEKVKKLAEQYVETAQKVEK
ncbi:uncharacterized protein At4g10930 [Rutidosis leptorrhynchoides]|uniref:uncharacterized protein At4g10930 n=1 Tax=Rutidosis leptorrhynchoides TaxID=125765 RepID=UPI003A98E252